MQTKQVAPSIDLGTYKIIEDCFQSPTAGSKYLLEAVIPLYRRVIVETKVLFSNEERCLIIDSFNSTVLTAGLAGQHLLLQVSDSITLDGLADKWQISGEELIEKIKSLTPFQCACLEIWACAFWRGKNTINNTNLNEYLK